MGLYTVFGGAEATATVAEAAWGTIDEVTGATIKGIAIEGKTTTVTTTGAGAFAGAAVGALIGIAATSYLIKMTGIGAGLPPMVTYGLILAGGYAGAAIGFNIAG